MIREFRNCVITGGTRINIVNPFKMKIKTQLTNLQYMYSFHFITPDIILVGTNSNIKVINFRKNVQDEKTLSGHNSFVWDISGIPNSSKHLFASGGGDNCVRLYDLKSEVHCFRGHTNNIRVVRNYAFIKNQIISGGAGTVIRIWDIAKRRESRSITNTIAYDLEQDKWSSSIVAACHIQKMVKVFDARKKNALVGQSAPNINNVWTVCNLPTKTIVSGGDRGEINYFDLRKLKSRKFVSNQHPHTQSIYRIRRISPIHFGCASSDQHFSVCDIRKIKRGKLDFKSIHCGSIIYDLCPIGSPRYQNFLSLGCSIGYNRYYDMNDENEDGDDFDGDPSLRLIQWSSGEKMKFDRERKERIMSGELNGGDDNLVLRVGKTKKNERLIKLYKFLSLASPPPLQEVMEKNGKRGIIDFETDHNLVSVEERRFYGIIFRIGSIINEIKIEDYQDYYWMFRRLGYASEIFFILHRIVRYRRRFSLSHLLFLLLRAIVKFESEDVQSLFFPKKAKTMLDNLEEMIGQKIESEKEKLKKIGKISKENLSSYEIRMTEDDSYINVTRSGSKNGDNLNTIKKNCIKHENKSTKRDIPFRTSFCLNLFKIIQERIGEVFRSPKLLKDFVKYLEFFTDYKSVFDVSEHPDISQFLEDIESVWKEKKKIKTFSVNNNNLLLEEEEEEDEGEGSDDEIVEKKSTTRIEKSTEKSFEEIRRMVRRCRSERVIDLVGKQLQNTSHLCSSILVSSDGTEFRVNRTFLELNSSTFHNIIQKSTSSRNTYDNDIDNTKVEKKEEEEEKEKVFLVGFDEFEISTLIDVIHTGEIKDISNFREREIMKIIILLSKLSDHNDLEYVKLLLSKLRCILMNKSKREITILIESIGHALGVTITSSTNNTRGRIQSKVIQIIESLPLPDGEMFEENELEDSIQKAVRKFKVDVVLKNLTQKNEQLKMENLEIEEENESLKKILKELNVENQ